MGIVTSDGALQVHKFLKDADALLGTIDNLVLDKVSPNDGSEAVPQLGTISEMAKRLQVKLQQLAHQ